VRKLHGMVVLSILAALLVPAMGASFERTTTATGIGVYETGVEIAAPGETVSLNWSTSGTIEIASQIDDTGCWILSSVRSPGGAWTTTVRILDFSDVAGGNR